MGEHTPGPWETGPAAWDENGDVMYTLVGIKKACAPDAQLIAAAPELLEAAETAKAVLKVLGWRNEAEHLVFDRCAAAIAKAKGENHASI